MSEDLSSAFKAAVATLPIGWWASDSLRDAVPSCTEQNLALRVQQSCGKSFCRCVAVIPSNFTMTLFVIVRSKVLMLQPSALKTERVIGKKPKLI